MLTASVHLPTFRCTLRSFFFEMSDLQAACAAFILMNYIRRKKKNRNRRWWQMNIYNRRQTLGGVQLLLDLKSQELSGQYKNFTALSSSDFESLLNSIGVKISKQNTRFRVSITAKERLALTLRYLATGDSFVSLQYLFRISRHSIGKIIPEVCEAITEELKENIHMPNSPEEWLQVAEGYEKIWQFSHCIGAIDGCQGRISDGGVFHNSMLYKKLQDESLNLPQPSTLPGRQMLMPYYFIGDEAFPLMQNMMKVYSGMHPKGSTKRLFNYRLCRARRVVENVFGLLSSVFRVLRKPILLNPDKAKLIVKCTCHLHNFIRRNSEGICLQENISQDNNTSDYNEGHASFLPLANQHRNLSESAFAKIMRDEIAEYCSQEGALEWQNQYA
ncbi:uncharacterized protein LOC113235958 isoform X2 [Hyposmocoma kahamanoa]|uniref:uncharacterized protein LOC113227749 isoform X2 n=1 Tax=Hyposmocoma kahamanoa TaxID=1477025 RepID=UPI000E6D76C1|nr:uncharacterized protein LOC113227749 isoform X2 [Hyposmocoma kahamanoa]XP_026327676.1 uncharacterized protein LOC113235958 isoform X2 [Hyposmocoma kahamanoa]